LNGAAARDIKRLKAGRIHFAHSAAPHEGGDQPLVFVRGGTRQVQYVRCDLAPVRSQTRRSQFGSDMRAAKRPAASERDVHAHPELARFPCRKPNEVEILGRQVAVVADSMRRIVHGHGIDRCDLETADAPFFHAAHLVFDLLAGDGGPEPPPAHHDAAVVGGRPEGLLERSGCVARLPG
jgi:hypothetical protein